MDVFLLSLVDFELRMLRHIKVFVNYSTLVLTGSLGEEGQRVVDLFVLKFRRVLNEIGWDLLFLLVVAPLTGTGPGRSVQLGLRVGN